MTPEQINSLDRPVHGESLHEVAERVIVAPTSGTFEPHDLVEGHRVEKGDLIGVVRGPGTSVPVTSPFRGMLMDVVAEPGERLREGQRVAWLRTH
jgi:biotin carboxyl carrier protein